MSNNRHKYFNKVPPFKPDPEHYTRKQHSWKAKEAYETEDDAWEYLNQNPKLKAEGMTVYRCRTATNGMWGIGTTNEYIYKPQTTQKNAENICLKKIFVSSASSAV